MDAALPRSTILSAADRQQVESWLSDFDRTWREDRLAERVEALPPPGDSLRRPALLGMIQIDLRRRWAQGRKALLEAYCDLYPELGPAGDAPIDLIEAECEARRAAGDAPTQEEIARRFPRRAEEMRRWLDANASAEDGRTMNTSVLDAAARTPPVSGRAAAPQDLPEQFGRYRILRRLGRGGMGSVYLAHDSRLDRQVALKVPQLTASDGPEVLERFLREARAAATIDHPNICPVYDVGEHDGVHFVTMAYIEGRPLSALVQGDKPLPQRPVADLVRKLALGLAEAHRRGVVHRDVKPANVMVNARHEPILVDFGLARRAEKDACLTRSGAVVGTPAYMAPEQMRGDGAAVGPRGDVYSLGVVLYELLAGRPPFQGPSAVIMAQVLTQAAPPLSEFRPDLDPALADICRKAMAKAADDRYAGMDDLAAVLDGYLNKAASPLSLASSAAPAAMPAEAEGMATRLLARLAERLDALPAPPTVAPRRRVLWYAVPLAAGVVVAAAVGIGLYFLVPARHPDAISTIPPVKEDKTMRGVEGANERPAQEAPRVAAVSMENRSPKTPERKPEEPPATVVVPAATAGVAVHTDAPEPQPEDAPPAAPSPELQAIIDKLGDADNEVRFKAAEELRQKKDKAAIPALIDRVTDDLWAAPQDSAQWPNSSKMAALKALRELAPDRVAEALASALRSARSEEVRAWACEELGNQKEKAAVDGLVAALTRDASVKVRVAAARALGGVHPPNAAALIAALQDEDDLVRIRAAVSLQQLGDRTRASVKEVQETADAATPALIARVADDWWSNGDANRDGGKRAALAALRDLAPGRAAEALMLAVRSGRVEDVRAWACQELGNQKDKEAAETLVDVLGKEPSAVVRAAAARGLGAVRPPNVAALVGALQDEDKWVRVRAAESLGRLADRTKMPPKEVALVVDGAAEALVQGVADDRWKDLHPYIDSSKTAELTALRQLAPGRATEALVLALRSARVEDGRAWVCEELGNQKDKEATEALSAALSADPSPMVREAASAALKKRP